MKGDRIPPAHEVARHCPPRELELDENRNPRAPTYEAFLPDADGVSVSWLDYFTGSRDERLRSVQQVINRTRIVRASHRLAVISVGNIETISAENSREVRAEHDPIGEPPEKENLAHALVIGITPEDRTLMEQLALNCALELCKLVE